MTMQKKLLVLVDGSQRSIHTAEYVKEFMPADGNTQIVLFHVFSGLPEEYRELEKDPTCAGTADQLSNMETEQKTKLREHMEKVKEILIAGGFSDPSVEIKFHLLEKGVARDIIDEARKGYSAVVMRRRGMGALKSIILGSVAVKLLQSLTFIPIIIVGQAPPVKKILLAVDASPFSVKAAEFAASMLGGHAYDVCIFHAIIGLGSVNFELAEMDTLERPEAQLSDNCIEAFKIKMARLFQEIKNILMASGFASEKLSEKITAGIYSRSEAIIKEAEDSGCGTIVVGRRGLSKVEAFFMGRVGHEVVYAGKQFTVWVV